MLDDGCVPILPVQIEDLVGEPDRALSVGLGAVSNADNRADVRFWPLSDFKRCPLACRLIGVERTHCAGLSLSVDDPKATLIAVISSTALTSPT